jgi:predicted acylesterase/phospholipase RssA
VTAAATHVPPLAAGADGGPRRSLLLAGGGIRVAYQAGVLVALEEGGIRFHHADGASGGTFNLAMLLSGVSPGEACGRWRALDVRAFATLWPARRLLTGPPYPALGSSAGIRRRVFPALGVDVERIRGATGIDATFNVCDFAAKECVAVPHTEVDLDVLTACVSLPILSPAVARDGRVLVDAVWIKDTNLSEALRREAEELWLVWCIGNHGVYRDGAFQQYVHMIEIAANGALNQELAHVRERGARLHVIRPRMPLPLDPDFFFGRVDAATLIAMGYRDAAAYLDAPHEHGVAADASATRMLDPVPGIAFRERLGGGDFQLRLGWEVDDLDAFVSDPRGTVVGDVSHPRLGTRRLVRAGRFRVEDAELTAELDVGGSRLELRRRLDDPEHAHVALDGSIPAQLSRTGPPPWRTLHARGVATLREGAVARMRFRRWLRAER